MKFIWTALLSFVLLAATTACSNDSMSGLAPSRVPTLGPAVVQTPLPQPPLAITPATYQVWTQTNPQFKVSGGYPPYDWSLDIGYGALAYPGSSEAEFRPAQYGQEFTISVKDSLGNKTAVSGRTQ